MGMSMRFKLPRNTTLVFHTIFVPKRKFVLHNVIKILYFSTNYSKPSSPFTEVSDDYAYDTDTQLGSDCTYQIPPNNGRFACEIKPTSGNDLYVPAGTVCRIKCNDHFEIPPHLRPASVFECQEGRWNSTMRHFCHKVGSYSAGMQHPKRRYG